MASAAAPYLSVVVAARNDDHGARFLHRMQAFVNNLLAQCDRHGLDAELVLVEWNPPRGPRLAEVLSWPSATRCAVRVIEVPPALHGRYAHADEMPLFQMIAKNVGIRRSRGDFVLATNVDVLFSDGLIAELACRRLKAGRVYRVDLHTVSGDIALPHEVDEQLRTCADHVVLVNSRHATTDLRTGDAILMAGMKVGVARWIERCGQIGELVTCSFREPMHRWRAKAWRDEAGRVPTTAAHRFRRGLRKRSLRLLLPRPLGDGWTELRDGIRGVRIGWSAVRDRWRAADALAGLHMNACGDFTIMAREHWDAVRGYPELEVSAIRLDSLLLVCAHYAGLRETFLPHRLYHQDHERRDQAVPVLSFEDLGTHALEMRGKRAPTIFNDEDWGLGAHALSETTPESPARPLVLA